MAVNHCTLKYRGRVVYDGPIQPGTITDPAWWTLPRRLWIRCTPSGRQYVLDRLTDMAIEEVLMRHVTDAFVGSVTVAVADNEDFDLKWEAAASDVRDALSEASSVWAQVRPALKDNPFPGATA